MVNRKNISGLILAGGAGTRVSGQDKGLLPWRGKPLVEHVINRLSPQIGELLISCNRNLEHYAKYSGTLIQDSRQDYQGPLAGIEAAAPLIRDGNFLIVVACDTPALPTDLVERLLEPHRSGAKKTPLITYANDGERNQYLFAAIHSSALNTLPAYLDSGQRTVRHWFELHRTETVDFSDQSAAFTNYNHLDTGSHSS
jgi:molybdopterin-guanine dinucleotide biosynthesis protein A